MRLSVCRLYSLLRDFNWLSSFRSLVTLWDRNHCCPPFPPETSMGRGWIPGKSTLASHQLLSRRLAVNVFHIVNSWACRECGSAEVMVRGVSHKEIMPLTMPVRLLCSWVLKRVSRGPREEDSGSQYVKGTDWVSRYGMDGVWCWVMMRKELYLNDFSGLISFGSNPCWPLKQLWSTGPA